MASPPEPARTLAELPPMPTTINGQPRRVNRVLGATAGSGAGNVRALVAVMAMLFLHGLFGVLLFVYTHGSPELKDFVLTWGSAMLALDVSAVQFYFGRRNGEGA